MEIIDLKKRFLHDHVEILRKLVGIKGALDPQRVELFVQSSSEIFALLGQVMEIPDEENDEKVRSLAHQRWC
jgi:hypothetical protein